MFIILILNNLLYLQNNFFNFIYFTWNMLEDFTSEIFIFYFLLLHLWVLVQTKCIIYYAFRTNTLCTSFYVNVSNY